MDDNFLIRDTRELNYFKKQSFSGYKKKDIFNALSKSMETKKVENACNWITECLCSGYIEESWTNLLLFASEIVSINNPNLPNYLYKKNILFYNIYNNIDKRYLFSILDLRNNQIIRNLFFSITTLLSISSKTKRYDKYPKLKDIDFNFEIIQKRLSATSNLLSSDFIHYNEPEELKIIMNEIYFHLKNKIGGYERCMYWTIWILEWEKRNIKAKNIWNIDQRIVEVDDKYKSDLIWILWELILLETKNRDSLIKKQINSLYELYKFEFNCRKRNKRLPYLLQSICFLTNPINNVSLISDKIVFIQSQCNNNQIFKLKKIHEKNDIVKDVLPKKEMNPKKVEKVEKQIDDEKLMNKLSIFNDLN